jgi:L-fuconolactonase
MTEIPPQLRVIDTHVHVWAIGSPWMEWLKDRPQHWDIVRRDFSWEMLRGVLDKNGIAELILVQACTTPAETRMLLALAAREPTVRGVVGWATLASAKATEADLASFEGAGSAKLVGIRNNHRWAPDGDILATPEAIESCRLLAARGLPLDLHVPDYRDLPVALRLIEQVPEGTYVIDHLGKPILNAPDTFAPWAAAMSALAEFDNVIVKYSGWATFVRRTWADDVRRHIDFVLERFGPARVMFGSNWPVALVAGDYEQTYRATLGALAGLAAVDMESVFRGTAERCYLNKESVRRPA